MPSRVDDTPVGAVTTRAPNSTTRRGTPWQERSPGKLWPTATAATATFSQGQHPAHTRHAIPTREHQQGGAPTRYAPTRRGHPARSPPHLNPGRTVLPHTAPSIPLLGRSKPMAATKAGGKVNPARKHSPSNP